ncbi:MAG: hypothetical protein ACR5K2_00690 [Wolbachia sp.]
MYKTLSCGVKETVKTCGEGEAKADSCLPTNVSLIRYKFLMLSSSYLLTSIMSHFCLVKCECIGLLPIPTSGFVISYDIISLNN